MLKAEYVDPIGKIAAVLGSHRPGRPVAVVGDNCIDFYPLNGLTAPGGNAVNVGTRLAGLGLPTHFYGRVGDDGDGQRIERQLVAAGAVWKANITAEPTCRGILAVGPDGTTTLTGMEGDCSYYRVEANERELLGEYRLAFMKGVDDTSDLFDQLAERGCLTAYDYSTFYGELGRRAADVSFMSFAENDEKLALETLGTMNERGALIGVAMMGAAGSIARVSGDIVRVAACQVDVIDTIGAGDAYIATLLAALLQGSDLKPAMAAASRAGADACTHPGSILPRPADRAEDSGVDEPESGDTNV